MANLTDILDAVVTKVKSISLAGISSANIKARMLPKIHEELDAVPCVIVSTLRAEAWEPIDMEGTDDIVYFVNVTIVAANNFDFVSESGVYFTWRERIRKALEGHTLAGAPTVWQIDYAPDAVFDPAEFNNMYAYQPMVFEVHSAEVP